MRRKKFNKKLFMELYNSGKSDYEISQLLGIGERTVSRHGQRLRKQGKIKPRKDLQIEEKLSIKNLKDVNVNDVLKNAKATWKIPQGRTAKKANKNFKIYLYIADHHVPEYNIPANKAIFKLMQDIKFDGFRIVGDFMDMSPISHWNEHKRKTLETQRLKKDYTVGNVLLDEYDKRLPKNCDKAYFWGNHEDWYNQLLEKLPVLEGLLNPTEELHLIKRGYKTYENINHIERIGRLSVCHGMYSTIYAVRKHIQEFKTNVLFFHTHRIGSRSESSPAKEISIIGYNGGCLCNKNPDYRKNRPSKWSHGFAVVYYMSNGYFYVDNVRIIKGKFIYNNKLYDGNE